MHGYAFGSPENLPKGSFLQKICINAKKAGLQS